MDRKQIDAELNCLKTKIRAEAENMRRLTDIIAKDMDKEPGELAYGAGALFSATVLDRLVTQYNQLLAWKEKLPPESGLPW